MCLICEKALCESNMPHCARSFPGFEQRHPVATGLQGQMGRRDITLWLMCFKKGAARRNFWAFGQSRLAGSSVHFLYAKLSSPAPGSRSVQGAAGVPKPLKRVSTKSNGCFGQMPEIQSVLNPTVKDFHVLFCNIKTHQQWCCVHMPLRWSHFLGREVVMLGLWVQHRRQSEVYSCFQYLSDEEAQSQWYSDFIIHSSAMFHMTSASFRVAARTSESNPIIDNTKS